MSPNFSRFLITKDNSRRGIISMLISTFWFSLLYAVVKFLGATYNVYEITFFRCLFALFIAAGMVQGMGGWRSLRTQRMHGHFLRAASGTAAMLTLFYSYNLLPMANVVAISFSMPLFVTLLSILVLHEKVNWQHWTALIIGFIGVLFIASPTDANVNWFGVGITLLSTLFRALSMIGIRALGRTEPASTTTFYFALQSTIFTAIPMPLVWQMPNATDFMWLASCGVLAGIGQYFLTRAYQFAPAAVVSPFDYTAILWAILFGFLFWHEMPSLHIIIGSVIVVLAGLFILYNESKAGKPVPLDGPPGMEPLK
jgi:drug/metabolite transporter (DMT)-like permease